MMLTDIQIKTIEARRVDDVARVMAATGFTMTWQQAEQIGDAGCQWLRDRLGLVRCCTDEDGIHYMASEEW